MRPAKLEMKSGGDASRQLLHEDFFCQHLGIKSSYLAQRTRYSMPRRSEGTGIVTRDSPLIGAYCFHPRFALYSHEVFRKASDVRDHWCRHDW